MLKEEPARFPDEVISKIASFFADKCNNPALAFQLANCGGGTPDCSSTANCCCSCASPCGNDNDTCGP